MRLYLYTPMLFMALAACQTSHTSSTAASTAEAGGQAMTSHASQIIFLDLELRRDSLTKESMVKLLNKTVTDGRMKNLAHQGHENGSGDLQCSLLSSAGQVLYSTAIPDPLANTLEYAAESGELQKKTFQLQQTTFTLRAPYYPGTEILLIEQLQEDKQLKEIARLTL
ncbi:hypothetical protein I0P70_11710 [Pontibacter sp. FD36]|uniref:hypothetical protein n=1 Tax=Pontibacter sp. FD36 TaxID=2789860 RepID=UPI0018A9F72D|nr:hypothetical protein [Pontibacter sp. FD36]MBF8963916.1 hypothetical protein [Pontibacter sp. FD36]